MTNKKVEVYQDLLKDAKLVAKLVAKGHASLLSPKVVALAVQYNEKLSSANLVLHQLASALDF